MLWLKRSSWRRKIADLNRPKPKPTAIVLLHSVYRPSHSLERIGRRTGALSWTQHRLRSLAGGWL